MSPSFTQIYIYWTYQFVSQYKIEEEKRVLFFIQQHQPRELDALPHMFK